MITSDNAYGALTFHGGRLGAVFVQQGRVRPERDWQAVLDAFLETASLHTTFPDIVGTYTLSEHEGGLLVTQIAAGDHRNPRRDLLGLVSESQQLPASTYGLLYVGSAPTGEGGLDAVLVVDESAAEEGRPVMLASRVDGSGKLVASVLMNGRAKRRALGLILLGLLDALPREDS